MSEQAARRRGEDEPLVRRRDALIRLNLEEHRAKNHEITIGDQIITLEFAGLEGKEVARILGIGVRQLPGYHRYSKKSKKPRSREQDP